MINMYFFFKLSKITSLFLLKGPKEKKNKFKLTSIVYGQGVF